MYYTNNFNLFGVEVRQRPCIKGNGKPSEDIASEEKVGELYLDEGTNIVYVCVHEGGDYFWKQLEPRDELEALQSEKFDKSEIVANYGEWFETTDGEDWDSKVPSIGVFSDFVEGLGSTLSPDNIVVEINTDEEYMWDNIPSVEAVTTYVNNKVVNSPDDIVDLGTFEVLYDENMNEVSNTTAGFYKAMDGARQTGVYKICMQDGRVLDDGTRNITLSETYLLFVIADVVGDHEVVTQLCLSQDTYNEPSPSYVHPPVIRKYSYDSQKNKYVWVAELLESTQFKVNDVNSPDINPMQCYPTVEAVSNFVNDKIVTNYADWFDNTDGSDADDKVPSIGIFSDFAESFGGTLSPNNIVGEIEPDEEHVWDDIPSVEAVKAYVQSQLHPAPITVKPITLETNKEYNFGWVSELSLSFPSIANDGDVVYATFFAEDTSDDMQPNLIINTTNTCDIEIIPEQSTGYEIFAKYNGEIWIVNYSEYTRTW